MLARWNIVFSGKVQHVGFRYTSFYLAKSLDLTGWVDNLENGEVEMEVQGSVSAIRNLIVKLKSRPNVRILDMRIREIEPVPDERIFEVRGY